MREFEEGNLLEVGKDLLQLLLVVEQRVVEGHSWRHAIDLYPQTAQVLIGNIWSPRCHLCRERERECYTYIVYIHSRLLHFCDVYLFRLHFSDK